MDGLFKCKRATGDDVHMHASVMPQAVHGSDETSPSKESWIQRARSKERRQRSDAAPAAIEQGASGAPAMTVARTVTATREGAQTRPTETEAAFVNEPAVVEGCDGAGLELDEGAVGDWGEWFTDGGDRYWHNVVTGETTWRLPGALSFEHGCEDWAAFGGNESACWAGGVDQFDLSTPDGSHVVAAPPTRLAPGARATEVVTVKGRRAQSAERKSELRELRAASRVIRGETSRIEAVLARQAEQIAAGRATCDPSPARPMASPVCRAAAAADLELPRAQRFGRTAAGFELSARSVVSKSSGAFRAELGQLLLRGPSERRSSTSTSTASTTSVCEDQPPRGRRVTSLGDAAQTPEWTGGAVEGAAGHAPVVTRAGRASSRLGPASPLETAPVPALERRQLKLTVCGGATDPTALPRGPAAPLSRSSLRRPDGSPAPRPGSGRRPAS